MIPYTEILYGTLIVESIHKATCTCILTLGQIALVHESWYDVAVLQVKVVMRPIDVGWDDTGEHTAILFMIGPG